MLRTFVPVCAAAVILASGISHRVWKSTAGEPATFAARLAAIPSTLGAWEGTDFSLSPRELAVAEATGYVIRRYVRHDTHAEVSVMLLCGLPGPMSVHPPNICYGGSGFKEMAPETLYKVAAEGNAPEAEFRKLDLQKMERGGVPLRLRIYYAWSTGESWRAPDNPRLAFGGAGALYKLYVTYHPAPGADLPDQDPCQEFLRDFLPELQRDLSPAP